MSKESELARKLGDASISLFEEDSEGRPAYKSSAVITSAVTSGLEAVSTYFGMPGLGAAISLILATIFRKKLDRLGQTKL